MIMCKGAVRGLVDVVKSAQKEKVVRVALLALKNLAEKEELVGGEGGERGGLLAVRAWVCVRVGWPRALPRS